MSVNLVCFFGIGLWAIITFFVVSALVVAGKADERLGYKLPLEELLTESDGFDRAPLIPGHRLFDPGGSERLIT
jgi:hypothetical protein